MENSRILLVDDEEGILTLLKITLMKEHFINITTATSGMGALTLVKQQSYDIILLDVMLGDCNGFDLCQEIRTHSLAPIIFVTARSTDYDKLLGLGIGGDDYITKPFNPLEVVARIKSILRRQKLYETKSSLPEVYQFPTIFFDQTQALLKVHDEVVPCTAKEIELMTFFFKHPNQLFTSSQLYERVWGEQFWGDEKTVAMHISKIRRKLGDYSKNPTIIVNMRGLGYKFIPPIKREQ
ncbi:MULTISPECIES: response regulator transcription factor [unclassified Psychrobacillus]|uniref:response regulator transcription factor n=1 Tax=unclassified Psychrobacillus TaxID=2636677 RepID=UPI0012B0335A|nr:response regulator [Bacillus sp. N3536]